MHSAHRSGTSIARGGIHSPLVILLSAVPGFGSFAYLAAKPVRSNRLLLRATADAAMRKVPWQLYERTHLDRLIVRKVAAPAVAVVDELRRSTRSRPVESMLAPAPGFIAELAREVKGVELPRSTRDWRRMPGFAAPHSTVERVADPHSHRPAA